MRQELLDQLTPQQRTALEDFRHGRLSAGALSHRLGPSGAPPGATQAWSRSDVPQPDGLVAQRATHHRSRHVLWLVALAALLGAGGAALAVNGLSAGAYRGSADRGRVVAHHHHHRARHAPPAVGLQTHQAGTPQHSTAAASPQRHKQAGGHRTAPKPAVKHHSPPSASHPVKPQPKPQPTNTTSTSTTSTSTNPPLTTTATTPTATTTPGASTTPTTATSAAPTNA